MPTAQLASRLTPRGWLIAGGAAVARDPVHLPVPAHGLPAELHDAGERRRTLPDGQDDEHAQRAGDQLRAAEQRHGDRRAVQPDRQGARRARGREPARQHPAGLLAVRKTEPRRKQLPAAGHLPARPAGPARRNDRQRPGRLRRAGRARAAELPEPDLRRKPERLLGRGAAVGDELARPELGARDRAAGRPRASPACS